MAIYMLIGWPLVQELMDYEGFDECACLANDEQFLENAGVVSPAYFVKRSFVDKIERHGNSSDSRAEEESV